MVAVSPATREGQEMTRSQAVGNKNVTLFEIRVLAEVIR